MVRFPRAALVQLALLLLDDAVRLLDDVRQLRSRGARLDERNDDIVRLVNNMDTQMVVLLTLGLPEEWILREGMPATACSCRLGLVAPGWMVSDRKGVSRVTVSHL